MSDFGRHWSLKIRGCTIAEHAVLLRLGDRHHEKTGLCYPGRESLSFELECSRRYLTGIFESLEAKRFLTRKQRFEPTHHGKHRQTSNYFVLNFDRWFPFHSEAVETEEKRLLAYFRHAVTSPKLAQGFLSVWLEKPYFPTSKTGKKNSFRRSGKSLRTKKAVRPVSTILWIAVASQSHQDELLTILPSVVSEIENDTHHHYEIDLLCAWLKA